MLEKPSKYTPPSHPARFKKQDLPKHYGGELSALQKKLQRRKRYPNMFPDEGTFLFWFLTQRWLHAFIALVRRSIFQFTFSSKLSELT